jgi:hypothetical protein
MPRHLIGQYQVKIINDGIKGHGPIEICEDEKSFGPYIIRRYIFFFVCARVMTMNFLVEEYEK